MIRPAGLPTVLLAGGGTGGHLFPGVAVADELRRLAPGARVLLACTARDENAAHGAACRLEMVDVRSPRATGGLMLPVFGIRLSAAVARSLAVLREHRPHVVIGLGGYGSVAPALAARLVGTPVILLEQNAVPGRATRLLSRFARSVAASLPGLAAHGIGCPAPVTGNPVRPSVLATRLAHADFGLVPDVPVLGVLGGSLGARGLNRAFEAGLPALVAALRDPAARRAPIQVLHATGDAAEALRLEQVYADLRVNACVRPFYEDMAAVYGTADALLCRSGGTTIAEITAIGLPSVLIPYPHHPDRHQFQNARELVASGAATVVEESELTPERLAAEVGPLIANPLVRSLRAREARRLGRPDAAQRVAELVLDVCGVSPVPATLAAKKDARSASHARFAPVDHGRSS